MPGRPKRNRRKSKDEPKNKNGKLTRRGEQKHVQNLDKLGRTEKVANSL